MIYLLPTLPEMVKFSSQLENPFLFHPTIRSRRGTIQSSSRRQPPQIPKESIFTPFLSISRTGANPLWHLFIWGGFNRGSRRVLIPKGTHPFMEFGLARTKKFLHHFKTSANTIPRTSQKGTEMIRASVSPRNMPSRLKRL